MYSHTTDAVAVEYRGAAKDVELTAGAGGKARETESVNGRTERQTDERTEGGTERQTDRHVCTFTYPPNLRGGIFRSPEPTAASTHNPRQGIPVRAESFSRRGGGVEARNIRYLGLRFLT